MQIRYKGMFAEVQVPAFRLVAKRNETLTVTEEAARSLLEQPDNYEPVDAEAKKLLKLLEREREERDVPDQPIFELVEATGRAVA